MKKLEKKIDAFIDSLKEDESAVVMCMNEKDEFSYASYASKQEVGAAIASILSDYFDDDEKEAETLAVGIVAALRMLVEKNGKAGSAIVHAIAPAAGKAALDMLKRLRESLRNIAESADDDKDNDEDCSKCDANKVCPLPNAIKYRKENHIPAPRNRKNKRNAKEEKGS